MGSIKEANFADFLTHLADHGVYHNPNDNVLRYEIEWGYFISPDNTNTQQILLSRELITKTEVDFNCSRLRIPKMKIVY